MRVGELVRVAALEGEPVVLGAALFVAVLVAEAVRVIVRVTLADFVPDFVAEPDGVVVRVPLAVLELVFVTEMDDEVERVAVAEVFGFVALALAL